MEMRLAAKSEGKESDMSWTRIWLHGCGLLCGLNQLRTVRITWASRVYCFNSSVFALYWGWREVEE